MVNSSLSKHHKATNNRDGANLENGKEEAARKVHAFYCFDVLYAHLYGHKKPVAKFHADDVNNYSDNNSQEDDDADSVEDDGNDDIDDRSDQDMDSDKEEEEQKPKKSNGHLNGRSNNNNNNKTINRRNGVKNGFKKQETESYPLFVTWNIQNNPSSGYRLRGCIGNFEPMPLDEGLAEYAIISAMRDRRFYPISTSEFKKLECCVSLLTNFEDGIDYQDWTVGVHGIYIHFPNPLKHPPPMTTPSSSSVSSESSQSRLNGRHHKDRSTMLNATYLPEIAPAHDWTKVETIDSAIHKAGYSGKITNSIRNTILLTRYQSSKVSVTVKDWQQWREAIGRPVKL